jgi:hypothetical protein
MVGDCACCDGFDQCTEDWITRSGRHHSLEVDIVIVVVLRHVNGSAHIRDFLSQPVDLRPGGAPGCQKSYMRLDRETRLIHLPRRKIVKFAELSEGSILQVLSNKSPDTTNAPEDSEGRQLTDAFAQAWPADAEVVRELAFCREAVPGLQSAFQCERPQVT